MGPHRHTRKYTTTYSHNVTIILTVTGFRIQYWFKAISHIKTSWEMVYFSFVHNKLLKTIMWIKNAEKLDKIHCLCGVSQEDCIHKLTESVIEFISLWLWFWGPCHLVSCQSGSTSFSLRTHLSNHGLLWETFKKFLPTTNSSSISLAKLYRKHRLFKNLFSIQFIYILQRILLRVLLN